jgi:hypothetical protein
MRKRFHQALQQIYFATIFLFQEDFGLLQAQRMLAVSKIDEIQ